MIKDSNKSDQFQEKRIEDLPLSIDLFGEVLTRISPPVDFYHDENSQVVFQFLNNEHTESRISSL